MTTPVISVRRRGGMSPLSSRPPIASPTPAAAVPRRRSRYTVRPSPDEAAVAEVPDFRWLMASGCVQARTHAGCLDVCPTGALFRSEFGTVVVQADVCNGCGYCVPACPFGVIERREPLPDKRFC